MSKFGLFIVNGDKDDWMRESDKSISIWDSKEEAESWRKNYTVHPSKYQVKLVSSKTLKEDKKLSLIT